MNGERQPKMKVIGVWPGGVPRLCEPCLWRTLCLAVIAVLSTVGPSGCRDKSAERWWQDDGQATAAERAEVYPIDRDPADTRPAGVPTPRPTPPGRAVYVRQNQIFIGDTPITVGDVLADAVPKLRERARTSSAQQFREELPAVLSVAIRDAIMEVLVYREANEATDADTPQGPDDVSPLDKAADVEIQRMVNEDAGGVQARYEQQLARMGTDLAARKKVLKRRLLVRRYLRDKLLPRVDILRRDLVEYFEANKEKYQRPRTVEFHMIQVWVEKFLPQEAASASGGPTAAQWADARRKADEYARKVLDEIQVQGIPFEKACAQFSHADDRVRGGRWLPISEPLAGRDGEMLPATTAALAMRSGQVAGPIESPSGRRIYIVKAGKVTPAVERSFVDVQPELRKEIEKQQLERLSRQYEDKLWERATIPPLEAFRDACLASELVRWESLAGKGPG